MEILVVDDGSKDQTLEILRNTYGNMPNVKILTKPNGGKTSALNLGFKKASNDVIVIIYVFLTLSPIGDIYFIFGMFTNQANKLLAFYLVFLIVDCTSAAFAFNLENEKKKPLKWLLIQRFLYRLIMVHVVIKSIISVVVGKVVGWNKLKRKESVDLYLKFPKSLPLVHCRYIFLIVTCYALFLQHSIYF